MDSKLVISKLRAWGCDVDGALGRMVGDEELYMALLSQYRTAYDFSQLRTRLESGDVKSSFELAHDIKGVSANLGITPIFNIAARICDILRGNAIDGTAKLVDTMVDLKKQFDNILD